MANKVEITPGFCPKCGSIFPPLKMTGGITCYVCEDSFKPTGLFTDLFPKIAVRK